MLDVVKKYYNPESVARIKLMSSALQTVIAEVTAQYNFENLYRDLLAIDVEKKPSSSDETPADNHEEIIEKQNQILDATEQYLKISDSEKRESIINEVDSLRKKEPWTRGDRLTLIEIIVTILIAIVTLMKSDSTGKNNTEVNVNINANINIYSNNSDKKESDSQNEIDHIRLLTELLNYLGNDDTESSNKDESSLPIDNAEHNVDSDLSENNMSKE